MATPVPKPTSLAPPAPLTRAQYLQIRAQMRTLTSAAKSLPLTSFAATIDQAEKDGPAKSPAFWAGGSAQLAQDKALTSALIAFVKGA